MSLLKKGFKHKTPGQKKSDNVSSGKNKNKIFLLIGGIILIAVALFFIGQAVYNILESNLLTDNSLKEAEELVAQYRPPVGERATPAAASADVSLSPVVSGEASLTDLPGPLINRPAGTKLGILVFDSIDGRKVPIIEGAEPKQLKEGAGHHEDMAYPGQSGNCLIFGHRNTVFRDFDRLKIGDTIQVQTEYGIFIYTIEDMQVVEPLDPLMFKGYDEPYLTLVTCYPFHFVGAAPKRYAVVCKMTGKK